MRHCLALVILSFEEIISEPIGAPSPFDKHTLKVSKYFPYSLKERITKARQWRKRYGGGMRQVGLIAAAGHYALENNIKFLKNDHLRAKSIAEAVSKIAPKVITPEMVDTNIVGLDLSSLNITSQELAAQLKEKGVLTGPLGPKYLRLVTHLDLDDSDINLVNEVLPEILKSALVR